MRIIEPRARRYYPADKGQRQLSRKLLRKRRPNALWEARITSDDDDDRIGVTHRRRMIRESILSTSFARSRPRNSRRHCSLRFAEFPQMTRVRIAVALLAHFRGLRWRYSPGTQRAHISDIYIGRIIPFNSFNSFNPFNRWSVSCIRAIQMQSPWEIPQRERCRGCFRKLKRGFQKSSMSMSMSTA